MRNFQFIALVFLVCCASLPQVWGKTVFRRTDKISENFKQLDLPPEEIDPNVAPPEAQPVKTEEETEVPSAEGDTAGEPVNVSLNEIPSGEATSPPAAAAAANAAESITTVAPPKPTDAGSSNAKPTAKPNKPGADKNPLSRYCKCSDSHCDCCRKFGLPLLPSGPGCAKISYLGNDEMSVSLKYGDITLASRRISAKRARPICVGLPGGYSQFCGRVYGLSRAKENFKACLAFELRAEEEVEASLRVSCFKFGPEGLRVAEAEPLPATANKDDEDDDDDDIFGFAAGGDDDEDEEDDYENDAEADDDDDAEDYAEETEDDDTEAPEDADYGGFSLGGLLDELDDDEDEKPIKKKPAVAEAAPLAADQTREHVESVQSKDEMGSVPVAATESSIAVNKDKEKDDEVEQATSAPVDSTTAKAKKSKKAKKNKKKKAANASSDESGFAYELFNGILDFFN